MAEHSHDDSSCCGSGSPPPQIALNPGAAATHSTTLRVEGMDCADEVAALEAAFRPLPGVREIRVSLVAGKVTVLHDAATTPEQLILAVAGTGMKARPDKGEPGASPKPARTKGIEAVGISGLLTGIGLVLLWLGWQGPANGFFISAIITGGSLIFPKAWRALRRGALDMNVLMTIAVAGAMILGEFSEGAAVAFLFALSELLEAFSLARARKAVRALMQITPATALLRGADGRFEETPVAKVPIGSTLTVPPGARIPLDGTVSKGESNVDQAPITGESMPVTKAVGDPLFAGTINGEGSLEMETTRGPADTVVARIIHLVEEAQSAKAPTQRFVDRFARVYTPAVMAAAALVILLPPLLFGGEWGTWFYRGLVLLVIACPCALVIATPVSIVSGLTALAWRGVLVKGGAVLESLATLRALALDKTGTLTEGKPRVSAIYPLGETSEETLLSVAAAVDSHSQHPLARAVVAYAQERGAPFERAASYLARNGRGAEAELGGHRYFVGNHRFVHELGLCTPELEAQLQEIEAGAQSVVVVGHQPHGACGGEVLGILAVGDTLRPGAEAAVEAIRKAGVRRILLLSGDNQHTATAFAKRAGISEALGDLLPEDKIAQIRTLLQTEGATGMIGDGVNDAPALAAATVGIAMGKGTDTALETADMALMQEDLGKVAEGIALARRTLGIIRFNIAFALGIKALFLLLAMAGAASLWLAILADTGATLLVIANALRLLRRGAR